MLLLTLFQEMKECVNDYLGYINIIFMNIFQI